MEDGEAGKQAAGQENSRAGYSSPHAGGPWGEGVMQTEALRLCMHPQPAPQHTHILSHHPLLAPQLLFDVRALTEYKKFDI